MRGGGSVNGAAQTWWTSARMGLCSFFVSALPTGQTHTRKPFRASDFWRIMSTVPAQGLSVQPMGAVHNRPPQNSEKIGVLVTALCHPFFPRNRDELGCRAVWEKRRDAASPCDPGHVGGLMIRRVKRGKQPS